MDYAERPNGAYGKSDIEGKTASEAASELGKERVSNERERVSQRFRSLDATPGFLPMSWAIPASGSSRTFAATSTIGNRGLSIRCFFCALPFAFVLHLREDSRARVAQLFIEVWTRE